MACSVTRTAVSPATSLDIDPSARVNGLPCRAIQAARQVSRRAASTEAAMSASMNATPWFCPIGRPNCTRVREYSAAYSTAARATPTAIARSEEHTSELQSHVNVVCRLLLEKKKKKNNNINYPKQKKKKKTKDK